MYKKKYFEKILSSKYLRYQDTELVGYLMGSCHKNLENKFIKKNGNVLEIGPGTSPHIKYLKKGYDKYYFLESSTFALNFLNKKFNKKNIIIKKSIKNSVPFKKKFFDRIIMSHVLEHISDPEKFLFKVMSKLKKGGYLSISLPTDPGLLWRLGRSYNKIFNIKKKLNLNNCKYDYMIATEHVNSTFNLKSILKYHFQKNIVCEDFLPFKFLKSLDFNLFYNLTIIK